MLSPAVVNVKVEPGLATTGTAARTNALAAVTDDVAAVTLAM